MFAGQTPDPVQIAKARLTFAGMVQSWRAVARRSDARARSDAEARVFNQMVVALAGWFDARGQGGVVAEVRMLALGITAWNGFFPEVAAAGALQASITGYASGDRIAMTQVLFSRLVSAYLDALAEPASG